MKQLTRLFVYFIVLIGILYYSAAPTFAATVKADDSVDIPENQTDLRDLYLFGNSITVDAPVQNDLTAAGGSITLNGDVTNSILVAGGDILIRSHVFNTLRAAGGNIVISGPVDNDLLLAAGNARITKNASVSGDLLFMGGQLQLEGPIKGDVNLNAGEVTINGTIDGNVTGNVGRLTLGNSAVIKGNLSYRSDSKAQVESGAQIAGKHEFRQLERPEQKPRGLSGIFAFGTLFKLATEIIIGLLLVMLLPLLVRNILSTVNDSPLTAAGTGFIFVFLWPVLSVFLLILLWLGVISFILYALILLLALFFGKILVGWWVMRWWEKRNKREYVLDWKAAVVGPVFLTLLWFVPIIGWLAGFIIYLIAVGGVVRYLYAVTKTQRELKPVKSKR